MNLMIMATFIEAKPFIELMPLDPLDQGLFPVFQKNDTILIISGMGKVNAAMATTYGCMNFRPDRVFNFGSAGAVGLLGTLGEIFQIGKAIEYDGFDFKTGKAPTFTLEILPGYRTVNVATGDIPVIEKNDRASVSLCAELVDMETSAVIRVCQRFKVRCHSFKFVTDTPDDPDEKKIREHIRQYRLSFYQFIAGSVLPVLLR